MPNLHQNDIAALLARTAGLSLLASDATFAQAINTLLPHYGPQVIAALGLISILSADLIRIISVPTTTQAKDDQPKAA